MGVILFMINTRKSGGCPPPFSVPIPVAIWAIPVPGEIQALPHPTMTGRKKGKVKTIKCLSRGLTHFGFWYPKEWNFLSMDLWRKPEVKFSSSYSPAYCCLEVFTIHWIFLVPDQICGRREGLLGAHSHLSEMFKSPGIVWKIKCPGLIWSGYHRTELCS